MKFEEPLREAYVQLKTFQFSDSQFIRKTSVNVEQVKVSDLQGPINKLERSSKLEIPNNDETNTEDSSEIVVCWICDQIISPEKSLKEIHILEHYEYIFDDILPSSVPFKCPECDKSHGSKMVLMRHFAFTHEKIYQMTGILTRDMMRFSGDTAPDRMSHSDGVERKEEKSSRDRDGEEIYLCPFSECSSEFTYDDLKYGSTARHMLNVHCLLPRHLKTGQYKFARKELSPGRSDEDDTRYVCPVDGCKIEFTFNDLKLGRAAKHIRYVHLITPEDLRAKGVVFVRNQVRETRDDMDDGIKEEESLEYDEDMDGEEQSLGAEEELSEEDESCDSGIASSVASSNTSISVNPKLGELNEWLKEAAPKINLKNFGVSNGLNIKEAL